MDALTQPIEDVRSLRSQDGIVVHLVPDRVHGREMMLSQPGVVSDPSCYETDPAPWRCTLDHPAFDDVRCCLLIDSTSGELYLLDSWPRPALAPAQREALLQDHARRHRAWTAALAAEHAAAKDDHLEDEDEDEDEEDDDGYSDATIDRGLLTLTALRG